MHGQVELPPHIAWSGLRVYDLDRPRQRMSLYRTVLAEGHGLTEDRIAEIRAWAQQWASDLDHRLCGDAGLQDI